MASRDKIQGVEKLTPHGVYEVRAQWDTEAGVWVAESEDVPGLVAEADSPNLLAQKLRTLIPELLELNGVPNDRTASFHILYQHEDSGVLTF
jgi:predicted RNase H-like HicB family nuclease